jgi:CheY-like chemotaxis protein
MDGLTATRHICALVANGERPYTPIVVSDEPYMLPRRLALADADAFASMLPLPQALTASCSEEERSRCKDAGMVELMAKPIKLAMLQARRRLLAGFSLFVACVFTDRCMVEEAAVMC